MITGTGLIEGHPCRLAVMDFSFMGGSMGSVVGEKFARACEHAVADGLPLVSVSSSGGARMQEGILALMQLPKTICALEELHDSGGVMLSVITHPTTGGLLASFASLGDVIVAEPGALMSFAGPRVVAQTTREKLPDDFGLSESNLRFGHIDAIVQAVRAAADAGAADAPFREGRVTTDAELGLRDRLAKLSGVKLLRGTRLSAELERLQRQLERLQEDTSDEEIWRRVELHGTRSGRTRSTTSSGSWRTSSSSTATGAGWTTTRSCRDRQARGPHDRAHRPPEGTRPEGAHEAELRHGVSRRATARRCA